MRWFQLDPESVAHRQKASGRPIEVPSRRAFVLRGVLGFTIVSVIGFAPWTLAGDWFYRHIGEAGLYAVCAIVFMGSAGLLLHPLILGPGSLPRFYALFSTAFAPYAVAWIAAWMLVGGHVGSLVGLLAGTVLMGWILARAFDASRELPKVVAALFLLNALGYFAGGVTDGWIWRMEGLPLPEGARLIAARTSWAILYGAGFGAGLGWGFYLCQGPTRARLADER